MEKREYLAEHTVAGKNGKERPRKTWKEEVRHAARRGDKNGVE